MSFTEIVPDDGHQIYYITNILHYITFQYKFQTTWTELLIGMITVWLTQGKTVNKLQVNTATIQSAAAIHQQLGVHAAVLSLNKLRKGSEWTQGTQTGPPWIQNEKEITKLFQNSVSCLDSVPASAECRETPPPHHLPRQAKYRTVELCSGKGTVGCGRAVLSDSDVIAQKSSQQKEKTGRWFRFSLAAQRACCITRISYNKKI